VSIQERKEITASEAKRLLEKRGEDLDPLQRRVLDYATKFSRISAENAQRLVEELVGEGLLENELAVQVVNSMPGSVEEVRSFLGRQRIIAEETVRAILGKIEKYRS